MKSGEKSQITVTLRTSGKKGNVTKTIDVFTNDPKNSKIVLKVTGNVEQ
ncbi:MAG: DUF1573 domain-containing protein [Bacteroidales bacterium]|nr:DUF1573 domain-containing protein [Bacteroidales bacterium]